MIDKLILCITRRDCYTCMRMKPVVEKLCTENNIKMIVYDELTPKHFEMLKKYNLTKAPSYIMINDGIEHILEGSFKPNIFKQFFGI